MRRDDTNTQEEKTKATKQIFRIKTEVEIKKN